MKCKRCPFWAAHLTHLSKNLASSLRIIEIISKLQSRVRSSFCWLSFIIRGIETILAHKAYIPEKIVWVGFQFFLNSHETPQQILSPLNDGCIGCYGNLKRGLIIGYIFGMITWISITQSVYIKCSDAFWFEFAS